jgi:hypothetical protein
MRIRDLFFHIHPQPFVEQSDKEAVGREVIDKFSTEQMSVWGRLRGRGSEPPPLVPLVPGEWQQARFTYWFLEEGNESALDVDCPQSGPGSAPKQYSDLWVNRSQAETIWRWLSLREAAILVYEATQGMAIANLAEKMSTSPDDIIEYFASHMLRECRVYAQRVPSTKYTLIPEDERDELKILDGSTRLRSIYGGRALVYVLPRINQQDVDETIRWAKNVSGPIRC